MIVSTSSTLKTLALLAALLVGTLPLQGAMLQPASAQGAGSAGTISEQQEDQMMRLLAQSPVLQQISQAARTSSEQRSAAQGLFERAQGRFAPRQGLAPAGMSATGKVIRASAQSAVGGLPTPILSWLSTLTVGALGVTAVRLAWYL